MNIKSLYEHNSKTGLKVFILIFLICIIPRILLLSAVLLKNNGDVSSLMRPDAPRYYETALSWAENRTYIYTDPQGYKHKLWDVPVYPRFLCFFFKIFGPSRLLSILLNIVLFGFSGYILYKLSAVLFGGRVGLVGAIIFAFYPSGLIYSLFPMSEPLFLLLFLSGVYFFILFLLQDHIRDLILASILMATSTLTREIAVLFPLIMAIMIFLKYGKRLKQAAKAVCLLIAIYMGAISPWCAYNYRTTGHYALSDKMYASTYSLKWRMIIIAEKLMAGKSEPGEAAYRTSGFLPGVKDYFTKRKHFFGGTGTVNIMRALGYDTAEVENTLANSINSITPIGFLKVLQNSGWGWVIFQFLAWLYIGFVYVFSFLALLFLAIKRKIKEVIAAFLILFYFLAVYHYHHTTRYFITIVPFLSLLCGYFFSILRAISFKKIGVDYAVR